MIETESFVKESPANPAPLFDITPLLPFITQKQLILTPNQRLARAIHQAWGLYCQKNGHYSWPEIPIYAISHWFRACWQDLRDCSYEPALRASPASEQSELFLWSNIIAEDKSTPQQASLQGLARQARQSRIYLDLWTNEETNSDNTIEDFDQHTGYQLFSKWLPRFRQEMFTLKLFTDEQILDLLDKGFNEGLLPFNEMIHLVGFQNLPPKQRRTLNSAAKEINELKVSATPGNSQMIGIADSGFEITCASQWAKSKLDKGCRRIGIIVPDLALRREQIERQFRAQLEPEYWLARHPNSPPTFNLSAGIPLGQTPLIKGGLELLSINENRKTLAFFCNMLNSPFWADSSQETDIRCAAEIQLRDLDREQINASEFRQIVQDIEKSLELSPIENTLSECTPSRETPLVSISSRLQAAADQARNLPRKKTFLYWANHASSLLETLGWPGTRALDSIEYQQFQHWQQVLEGLIDLDSTQREVSWPEALQAIRQLAGQLIFQAKTPDSPIQILGVLEAVGLTFDALWVTGMSEEDWPQPVQLQALLPARLQKEAGMPRSNAENEITLARELITGFTRAAREVVFSYPQREGDIEKRPSPLLKEIISDASSNKPDWIKISQDHPFAQQLAFKPNWEWVEWGKAPPFNAQIEGLRGGSNLFRDQAACPFNAFARWRLEARPLPEPGPGLSAFERGNLTHRCLEVFWREVNDQHALLAMTEIERNKLLSKCIDDVTHDAAHYRPELKGLRFRQLEKTRLQDLLQRWLDLETERPAFIVGATEHAISLTLDPAGSTTPLRFPLRIDRIDLLSDGRLMLIDYKTGKTNISHWAGERLEEPQLPLYALGLTESTSGLNFNNCDFKPANPNQAEIAAICFAQISRTKGLALKGITDNAEYLNLNTLPDLDLPESWTETIVLWRSALEAIAGEFIEGDAEIVPYTSVVDYHDSLLPLNRMPELEELQHLMRQTNASIQPRKTGQ